MSLFTQSTWSKTVRGIGVTALAGSLAASALMVPAQAAAATPTANCTTRCFEVSAKEAQGLPGQYQMAQSKKTGSLWVAGTSGRPPMETATIAKVNPDTLKIEAAAALPTVRSGTGQAAGYQLNGAFGIDVDDTNGTIWVTNTRTNAVSVFDQNTLQQIWTSFGTDAVSHTRDVRVDAKAGKAFVGDASGIVAFDLKTYKYSRIDLGADAGTGMNPYLDTEAGKLYVPDFNKDVLNVIDTASSKVEKKIALHKDDAATKLSASDVTVDHSLKEIYVSSQGGKGKNSGVGVYDLTTGQFKKFIPFGTQALAIDGDENSDMVYVSDFSNGQVGVLDAKTGTIVSQVKTGRAATEVFVGQNGSAYALDKAGKYGNATVPFTLDYTTGQTRTFNAEQKGYGAQLSPINADSIYKIDVKASDNKDTPAPTAEKFTAENGGATVSGVKVAESGKVLEFSGTGWKNSAGTGGNVVALKLDGGAVSTKGEVKNPASGAVIGNKTVVAAVKADADGKWTAQVPFPTVENSSVSADAWKAGSAHQVTVLSGSLQSGDSVHSVTGDFTIGAVPAPGMQTPSAEVPTVSPSSVSFQGYPTPVGSYQGSLSDITFSDVNNANPFYSDIQWVANTGIATGWSDGTYRSLDNIDRGAMAAYLYRLAGSPKFDAPASSPFKDVPTTHEFYKEISWLQASGITTGWSDGTFRPDQAVNRDAMAAFFYRAAGSPAYNDGQAKQFQDVKKSDQFSKEISWARDHGITKGWDDNTYRPGQPIHRDAMAAFVHRFAAKYKVIASAQ